ncbi:MAG: branched-chain amino acid ABC transporter permease, partial [Acidimicrobiales bacterium]|nr:branched-chain amino acid ABC transporter permease [Acidimicrobiales bacterium]
MTPVLALLGWTVSLQAVFNGMVLGLGYAVIAAGLVLIYRSSGIINVAQAAVGAFGVNAFVLLFLNYDIPYPLAMAVGVAASVAIGVITELLVIRRLFDASRVVVLIATVGVAQLITFLIVDALPDSEYGGIPVAFNAEWANIQVTDSLRIGPRETSVLLLIIPVLVGLAYFLNRTKFGLHIRAVADDAENARLVGVSPKKVSTVVWGLAAGFAGYTAIVIAPLTTRTAQELGSVSTVGLLLRALVIGLAARMKSIPLVVVSGLILGAAETLVSINLNLSVG